MCVSVRAPAAPLIAALIHFPQSHSLFSPFPALSPWLAPTLCTQFKCCAQSWLAPTRRQSRERHAWLKTLRVCLRVAWRAAADTHDARVGERQPASMQQTCAGNTHTHTHRRTGSWYSGAFTSNLSDYSQKRERAAQALLLCALFFPQEKITSTASITTTRTEPLSVTL